MLKETRKEVTEFLKKMFDYQKKILNDLCNEVNEKIQCTSVIAKKINVSSHTALKYLRVLKKQKKVVCKKLNNARFWSKKE
jgi:ribosomal protein S25